MITDYVKISVKATELNVPLIPTNQEYFFYYESYSLVVKSRNNYVKTVHHGQIFIFLLINEINVYLIP